MEIAFNVALINNLLMEDVFVSMDLLITNLESVFHVAQNQELS